MPGRRGNGISWSPERVLGHLRKPVDPVRWGGLRCVSPLSKFQVTVPQPRGVVASTVVARESLREVVAFDGWEMVVGAVGFEPTTT